MLRLIILVIALHGPAPVTVCSHLQVPTVATVTTYGATANRHPLDDGPVHGLREWWIGNGTQVELRLSKHRAPACVTAQTWQRRVTVRLRLIVQ